MTFFNIVEFVSSRYFQRYCWCLHRSFVSPGFFFLSSLFIESCIQQFSNLRVLVTIVDVIYNFKLYYFLNIFCTILFYQILFITRILKNSKRYTQSIININLICFALCMKSFRGCFKTMI
jgi:hypothetical protein